MRPKYFIVDFQGKILSKFEISISSLREWYCNCFDLLSQLLLVPLLAWTNKYGATAAAVSLGRPT